MLRKFWEHKATHFVVVILVFTVTGSSVGKLSALLSSWIGLEKYSLSWWLFLLVAMLPIYQVLLLVVAFLFGKFEYFKAKQLRLWKRISSLFKKKEQPTQSSSTEPENN